jgi:hypothetical protein
MLGLKEWGLEWEMGGFFVSVCVGAGVGVVTGVGHSHANLSLAADFHFHVRYFGCTVRSKVSESSGGTPRLRGDWYTSEGPHVFIFWLRN